MTQNKNRTAVKFQVTDINNLGKVHHLWLKTPTEFLRMELFPYLGGKGGKVT
jgi:hypothetical protein